VHLRPITRNNLYECLALRVGDRQGGLVAANGKSLAEAYVDSNLVPLGIYPIAARGHEQPNVAMVGFTMYQVEARVGFILRLMIDRDYQRQGYGRATMIEVIRRLLLHPEVEMIATSHRRDNDAMAQLCAQLGFVDWEIDWATDVPDEIYLWLPDRVLR